MFLIILIKNTKIKFANQINIIVMIILKIIIIIIKILIILKAMELKIIIITKSLINQKVMVLKILKGNIVEISIIVIKIQIVK